MTAPFADLRALAEAATPGPWNVQHQLGVYTQRGVLVAHTARAIPFAYDDAAYIAAASPTTLLAILDAHDAAVAERDEARIERDAEAKMVDLVGAERDAFAALLQEALEFWAHYSSLNEGAQDDMNAERHAMLAKMSDALDARKE